MAVETRTQQTSSGSFQFLVMSYVMSFQDTARGRNKRKGTYNNNTKPRGRILQWIGISSVIVVVLASILAESIDVEVQATGKTTTTTTNSNDHHHYNDTNSNQKEETSTTNRRRGHVLLPASEELYYNRAIEAAQAHADWQNDILNNNDNNPPDDEKAVRFLIFKELNTGLGNRMEAAISSFLYAMVTKRVFVYRANKLAKEIDSAMAFPLDPFMETDPRVQRFFFDNNKEHEHLVKIEEAVRICEDISSKDHPLMQHRRLVLEGNMYFGDLMFYNPHLRPWLEERFGPRLLNGNNPFRPLFRWFVTLQPEVQRVVDTILQNEFHNHNVIGLQMRMTESYANVEQADTFWDCAENAAEELFGSSATTTKPPQHQQQQPYNNSKTTTRFFISTDNPQVQHAARKRFGDRAFWRANITRSLAIMQFREMAGAISDVVLLSECNGLVVTQGSSFGRMAYASSLSGERPWFVTFQSVLWNHRNHPHNTCQRSVTTKPCSDRVHKLLLSKRTAGCLSTTDQQEAYAECDNS